MKVLFLVFKILTVSTSVLGSRILFIFPTPSKSHMIIAHALSTALAEKGHDVTVVSPFPLEKSVKNHRNIYLPLSEGTKNIMNNFAKNPTKNFFKLMSVTFDLAETVADDVMESEAVKEIWNEQFDLLVFGVFVQNIVLGIAEHFNCPAIMLSVQRHLSFTSLLVANPLSINAVPHFQLGTYEMNFIERVKNLFIHGMDLSFHAYLHYIQEKVYE